MLQVPLITTLGFASAATGRATDGLRVLARGGARDPGTRDAEMVRRRAAEPTDPARLDAAQVNPARALELTRWGREMSGEASSGDSR